MKYVSTRNAENKVTASLAIAEGLSKEGGLYTPVSLPVVGDDFFRSLIGLSYQERAAKIMKLFLDDFTEEELAEYASKAYAGFDGPAPAPVRTLRDGVHFLELWHGPTCAFKDMALQMLPYLLTASLRKNGEQKQVCILVATSGDTGKAALEGFRDVDQTRILVFFPDHGVSAVQQLQMTTQRGKNVGVCAVKGNFDDAQTGVKAIFSDAELREKIGRKGFFFSSANSINWGRVLPQLVYYISGYCDLVRDGRIAYGDRINICVPTGNFGNILSAYFTKQMGLPIAKLICASNKNCVLTDFLNTGTYNRCRDFYTTMSPSMDILISSNLERLLFELSGQDDGYVSDLMEQLKTKGTYTVTPAIKKALDDDFAAGFCDDGKTAVIIRDTFEKENYLIDPHTAVGYGVWKEYAEKTGDRTPVLIASTASPYKFCDNVLRSLGETVPENASVELFGQLEKRTGTIAPTPLRELAGLPVRFTRSVEKEEMISAVSDMLN